MANYNSGVYYNRVPNNKGFNYDNKPFIYTVSIFESGILTDDVSYPRVNHLITYKMIITESHILNVLVNTKESVSTLESAYFSTLVQVAEKLNIIDSPFLLYASLIASESAGLRENLSLISKLIVSESLGTQDFANISVLVKSMESFKLKDMVNVLVKYSLFEQGYLYDEEPRKAISDFYIDADGYLSPFNLRINYGKTNLSFMPEAIDTSIELAGRDGELIQTTKYGSREFDIFAVTLTDGLTFDEKAEIKEYVAEILHSIKNETKKLAIGSKTYDVKYSGAANISTNAPSWLEFEIPLKSESSYSKELFDSQRVGSGLIRNTGIISTGIEITINGYVSNPSMSLNGVDMEWNGTIASSEKLIIDTGKSTVRLVSGSGSSKNAMSGYNKAFPKIGTGGNNINFYNGIGSKCTVKWSNYHL